MTTIWWSLAAGDSRPEECPPAVLIWLEARIGQTGRGLLPPDEGEGGCDDDSGCWCDPTIAATRGSDGTPGYRGMPLRRCMTAHGPIMRTADPPSRHPRPPPLARGARGCLSGGVIPRRPRRKGLPVKPANAVLSSYGTTIFTVMSKLAVEHGAVNLGQGFPEGLEPPDVLRAAAEAAEAGPHQYPPMMGIPEPCAGPSLTMTAISMAWIWTPSAKSWSPPAPPRPWPTACSA